MHSTEKVEQEYATSAVQISQYKKEFDELLTLYKQIHADVGNEMRVLEIGTHYGGTLFHWLDAVEAGKVVAVDDHHINHVMYDQWVQRHTELVVIKGNSLSLDVSQQFIDHGPYDFIFIDGGHDLKTVTNDFQSALVCSKRKGSVIVFHDILPHPNSEVSQLWGWLRKLGLYNTKEFISDDNQLGCGIGVITLE